MRRHGDEVVVTQREARALLSMAESVCCDAPRLDYHDLLVAGTRMSGGEDDLESYLALRQLLDHNANEWIHAWNDAPHESER